MSISAFVVHMTTHQLRILMLGAFDINYPRHHILIAGLQENGVQVTIAAISPKCNTRQRIALILRWWRKFHHYDLVLIPAFNQLITPIAALFAFFAQTRLAVDYLVGLTDVEADRKTQSRLKATLYKVIDQLNISRVDTFTDTAAHRDWFARNLGVSVAKMGVIPVGAKPAWLEMPPPLISDTLISDTLHVGFVGTYIPFQGVEVILQAAHLLRDEPRIHFHLIGSGQTYKQSRQLAESLNLPQVTFDPAFYETEALIPQLKNCDVLLGVFGDSEKTAYVIPNKVFDGLAAARVVITADAPPLHEYFTANTHFIAIEPKNPQALATALKNILENRQPALIMGNAAREAIIAQFLPVHIGEKLLSWLKTGCTAST